MLKYINLTISLLWLPYVVNVLWLFSLVFFDREEYSGIVLSANHAAWLVFLALWGSFSFFKLALKELKSFTENSK